VTQRLAVDHVVTMTAPGVEHLGVGPGLRIEQGGGRGEALRPLLDRLAAGRGQVGHGRKSSIISPAVALAEPTTPGMPAPGWAPAPTKYRFGIVSSRLWVRNQALWVRIGSSEKAEPCQALSSRWKSAGVKMRLTTRSRVRFGR